MRFALAAEFVPIHDMQKRAAEFFAGIGFMRMGSREFSRITD
jgi:hypothetical protein